MGTPHYMAPEQIEAPGEADHRPDIYALGVVFCQMLTGELPGMRIEPPSKKVHLDVRLDEVVLRALAKNPELRYQQASVLKTQAKCQSLRFEGRVLAPASILNHAENRRRTKRLEQTQARLAAAGQKLPPLVKSLQRCTQHSVKFIRWIRTHLVVPTSCTQALASLATLYAKS